MRVFPCALKSGNLTPVKFSKSKATEELLFSSVFPIYLASEEVSSETLASPVTENVVKINTNVSKINYH